MDSNLASGNLTGNNSIGSKVKTVVRIFIAAAACGFILYGTARGEMEIVLNKAVNICLECIGLG